jgi:hypothetical protein
LFEELIALTDDPHQTLCFAAFLKKNVKVKSFLKRCLTQEEQNPYKNALRKAELAAKLSS